MNIKFSRFLLLALLGPTLLLAKERKKETITLDEPHIVRLSEIVNAIETGMPVDQFRNMIIECPQGAELPIKMMVTGDMISLEPNLITIKLLKSCYLKASKGPLLISTDLKKWEKADDFFVTQVAAGLEFQKQMVQINLEFDLNQNATPAKSLIHSEEEARYRQLYWWSSSPDFGGFTSSPPYYQERIEFKTK